MRTAIKWDFHLVAGDRTLFLSLLFDAKMTDGFSQNFSAGDDSE
jgi:hypothetical protein